MISSDTKVEQKHSNNDQNPIYKNMPVLFPFSSYMNEFLKIIYPLTVSSIHKCVVTSVLVAHLSTQHRQICQADRSQQKNETPHLSQ